MRLESQTYFYNTALESCLGQVSCLLVWSKIPLKRAGLPELLRPWEIWEVGCTVPKLPNQEFLAMIQLWSYKTFVSFSMCQMRSFGSIIHTEIFLNCLLWELGAAQICREWKSLSGKIWVKVRGWWLKRNLLSAVALCFEAQTGSPSRSMFVVAQRKMKCQ